MSDRSTGEIELTAPPVDKVLDLHGDPLRADLVVFLNGNQWMVMEDLLVAFHQEHPEVKNIFYETLPPGILLQQIRCGTLRMGELIISVPPDVYTAGREEMESLLKDCFIKEYVPYAKNHLAIMVPQGNPQGITGWQDLGRPGVRVVMPNPETEGVGRLILKAMKKTGGRELVEAVMEKKLTNEETFLTQIHHRQTLLLLMDGNADAGPVWISEALYQKRIGSPLDYVPILEEQNESGTYFIAIVERTAQHRVAAAAFLDFMRRKQAQDIYAGYGFSSAN